MSITLSRFIDAPIDEVFAFFDDPGNTLEFNQHAAGFDLIRVEDDGRRTVDIAMSSGSKRWMQTVAQVVREPPTRLVTTGGTWTSTRDQTILIVTTDRRFAVEGHGTRVDVVIDAALDASRGRPWQAVVNRLRMGATRAEFGRQLDQIAARIEARQREPST